MADQNTEEQKTGALAPAAASTEEAKPKGRDKDEIALELMKFVAMTTEYGKGSPTAGFSGKAPKSAEEYADSLLQLFEKCRGILAKSPAK